MFMRTLSCRCASFVVGLSLFLAAAPIARATISVESSSSFGNVSLAPTSGSIEYLSSVMSSVFSQAGGNAQYNSGASSTANSSDTLVTGGSATGFGNVSASSSPSSLSVSGSSRATGSIPGSTAGFDTSTGRASAGLSFEITGVTGPVSVTFSTVVSGQLTLSSDQYGVLGQGETDFALSVNGNPVLFSDLIQSIGANQTLGGTVSQTLTETMTLMGGTQYYLYMEADSEAMVVNSSISAVPEPAEGSLWAACLALSASGFSLLRKRFASRTARQRLGLLLVGALAGLALSARATYIGSDKPDICATCGAQSTRQQAGAINTSLTEGNSRDDYQVVNIQSAYGPTLPFSLTYNSYNADGSRAQLDTGLGFGWTHTYNTLLFQQRGQMFRLGPDGRVTQFYQNYSGNTLTYTSDTGFFETMTMQPDGSYIVSNKFKSWWKFGSVPGSSLLVAGPVYQLLQMGDRNTNITTFTYNGGQLNTVMDTYGRTLQFSYNAGSKLSQVTDPMGRTTTFTYDAQGRMPIMITDPSGKTVQYTYNSQYQITRKVDRDGRTYFYTYKGLRPFMVTDSTGQPWFSLTNSTGFAVNQTNVTFSLQRQYTPGTTGKTDGRGNTWQYSYDTNGYINQTTAPDGSTTKYTYDPGTLQISSKTDPNNNVTRYQYDAEGNRTNMTDALGNITSYTYDPVFSQMTSMTDPNGRTTTYTYDGAGNQIKKTDPIGQTQSWTYDSHGNVLSMTDQRGNTTAYTYDSYGELIQATDPLGNTTRYAYDLDGNRTSMTDANGNTTTYTYDSLNRLINTIDPLGNATTTTYDSTGNVISRTDADNHTTYYDYDTRSRLVDKTNALNFVTQTTYDANDNVISTTDENGRTTSYTYDSLNRKISTIDPLGNTTMTAYDPVGNVISTTDANSHTTTYTYDALNRRISMTDPLGNTTSYDYANTGGLPCCGATAGSDLITEMVDANGKITYYNYDELNRRTNVLHKSGGATDVINPTDAVTTTTYDADSNVIEVTDPNNNVTKTTYDADNRVIGVTNAAGDVTTTVYDPVGNVNETVDPRGNVTTYVYDADNRMTNTTDSVGPVTSQSYDGVGNVIMTTNGNGNVTTTTYDAINRVIAVADPLGHTTSTVYDPVGNVVSTTDRNGNVTTHVYDADNRMTNTTDALGNLTTTAYDPVGNVIEVIDPLSHITSYTYDADNRLIQETDADTHSRSYTYDGTDHKITRLDQNGHTTTYTYDDFYYMTERDYSDGSPSDVFIYDLGGRLTNATRNDWTNTFTYDGANRPLITTETNKSVIYSYDIPSGLRIIIYPDGTTITEHYDLRSRLIEVDDGGSPPITQYTYDSDNNVVIRTNRNNTVAKYTYNANDWDVALTHSNLTGLLAGFSYTYDNEGNRLYQSNQTTSADSEGYIYDALYRLTNYDVGVLSGGVISPSSLAESYYLDAVGNWTRFISNSVTQTRTHDPANEISSINSTTYTYDLNGNLLDDGTYRYAYDVENRVTSITRESDSAVVGQYSYDALCRRITSVLDPAGSPSTVFYFYDEAGQILEQADASETTQAIYTYGRYVDEPLTMIRGGQTYYYHPNAHYNIELLTDGTGTPVERYTYDAYGEPVVTDGSYNPISPNAWGTPHSAIGNFYLFTGRELDEESGLYFYRARYYDSLKGRFLQRDPICDAYQLNLYEYAGDNPIGHLDPSGLWWHWEAHKGSDDDLAVKSMDIPGLSTGYWTGDSKLISWAFIKGADIGAAAAIGASFLQHAGAFSSYTIHDAHSTYSVYFDCDFNSGAVSLNDEKGPKGDPASKGPLTTAIVPNWKIQGHNVDLEIQVVIQVSGKIEIKSDWEISGKVEGEVKKVGVEVGGKIGRSTTISFEGGTRRDTKAHYTLRCACAGGK